MPGVSLHEFLSMIHDDAGQKRQSVHQEGNNALSSRRRNAISCDPSVGDKVESWFITRVDLNLLNTQENTGLCHCVTSVRKSSVVNIKNLILAINGS